MFDKNDTTLEELNCGLELFDTHSFINNLPDTQVGEREYSYLGDKSKRLQYLVL